MSRFAWGLGVYLPILALWLGFELSAVFWKACPWPTLSRTCWDAEDKWPWFQYAFLFGLAVLLVHIVTGFPYRSRP